MHVLVFFLFIGWVINIIHAIVTDDWNDPLF
jgi:hypothetical protein